MIMHDTSDNIKTLKEAIQKPCKNRDMEKALLLDDSQEEYRPYAGDILENLKNLVGTFREAKSMSDGVCIMWSAWTRTFDDGISNAMDRRFRRYSHSQSFIVLFTMINTFIERLNGTIRRETFEHCLLILQKQIYNS